MWCLHSWRVVVAAAKWLDRDSTLPAECGFPGQTWCTAGALQPACLTCEDGAHEVEDAEGCLAVVPQLPGQRK